MKKSRFSEQKIIRILGEQDSGRTVTEICKEYGISQATFFNWKKKYGGMSVKQVNKLKELEKENQKLKQLYADKSLENNALKELIEKKV